MPTDGRASDVDESLADVPVLGWLTGASGRRDAARNEALQRRQEAAWGNLINQGPTAEDLSVNYTPLGTTDEYGDLIGEGSNVRIDGEGASSQRHLMDALNRLANQGGYSQADRAQQQAMAAQNAQQVGAMNQAALRGMEARGMGGGGAALASQLSGSQALAGANAQNQAQIQQAAMNRLMQTYGMQGQLAGQQNDQALARQQALDAYNQRQLDWRRQRGLANTGLANRSKESLAGARQQAYENRERGVAGLTQQYAGGQNQRNAQGQRQDQNNQQQAGFWGSLLSGIFG